MGTPIRSIALFYGHVASNLGDLAINRGEIVLIRRVFPEAQITVVQMNGARADLQMRSAATFDPVEGEQGGAVRLVGFRPYPTQAPRYALDPGSLLDMVGAANCDLIVLAAGEHLFEYADAENGAALFWRILPAFAARARGLRCMMLPSTLGPFETPESAELIGAALGTGFQLALREPRSAALLAVAAPTAAAIQGLDPAFFLDPPPRPAGTRRIALTLRSEGWGIRLSRPGRAAKTEAFEADGYRSSRALRFATAFAERALAAGNDLRLVIQTKADQALVEAIAAHFRDAPEAARIELVAPQTIEDYLALLAECDAVVGARFHTLVLGLVVGRPVFGVWFGVHGHKIPGLFEMIGRSDLAFDLGREEPETVAAAVFARLAAAPIDLAPIEARLAQLRDATQAWLASAATATEPTPGLDLDSARPLLRLGFALAQNALTRKQDGVEASLREARVHAEEAQRQTEAAQRQAEAALREAEKAQDQASAALSAAEARSQDERTSARYEIQALRAERVQADREYQLRAQRMARVTEALSLRLKEMETSESWRIGHGLVRLLTAPKRLLSRPPTRRPSDADAILPEAAKTVDHKNTAPIALLELLELFDKTGAAGVIAALRTKVGADPALLGPALMQSARALAEAGVTEAEHPLVVEMARLDRSTANLRVLYWAAQRAGDLKGAWSALTEIEELYGPNPTAGQKKFLAKMRFGPIVNVALLESIRSLSPRAFESVPGRIAYVLHNSLPYSSGGYATRAQGLALGLQEAGFEVVALSRPGFPRDTKPELLKAELPAQDIIEGVHYQRADRPLRDAQTSIADYVPAAAEVMEAQFRELRPEVVIAASAYLSALPALIAARRLGLPFIYEVRGFWEITRISRNPALEQSAFFKVQRLLEAEIGRNADHVFTLTGPMREELIEREVPAEKITLLPNSCDPARFTPRPRDSGLAAKLGIPPDVPVIGYIGTFVQYEGLDDLARAAALLRRRGLVFRLMLVGNENTSGTERGPITTEIEQIAAEEGLADWLILPGRVPHAEVEAYYSLIDVAPFPRKPQPVTEMVSPMKPLEALAMEKAVVVSSVRALTEMVADGETGLVFAKGDVESLAEVLAWLIGDAELRSRLGRAGRAWVARERTWTATAEAAKVEILRVLAQSAASPEPQPEALADQRAQQDENAPDLDAAPLSAPPPTGSLPELAPLPEASRDEIVATVRAVYAERNKARKKPPFSNDDWARTRLAFDMLEGVPRVADIGIGQAQLANLLARSPEVRRVVGYDFRDYSTRVDPPRNGRYDFRVWDITRPLAPEPETADVVVVMEVLEHIAVDRFAEVLERLRALSPDRAILVTVPYREKHPLYHHDKQHGHQQSFDDESIERLFGPSCIYSDYRKKWYFVLAKNGIISPERLDLLTFKDRARELLRPTAALDSVQAGASA